MVKSVRGLILAVVTIYIQLFCINGLDKTTMTFQLNKIQGQYKTYTKKLRSLDHLSDSLGDSTPIFGNSSSLNYYFVNVYLGNPPQKQSVIIDTGSHLTAVPCMPYCQSCGKHMNSYYDAKKSNSSEIVDCNSATCKKLSIARCEEDSKCSYSSVNLLF
jgi:hypothetical protein